MTTVSASQAAADRLLDGLADELLAQGLVEFGDFYMPHRVVVGRSPLPASEMYGIIYDDAAGGFCVYYRDMGVMKDLLEKATFEEARELYVEKVSRLAAHRSGRG